MLWRVALAVAAVSVGGICVQADLMSKLIMQRDYGVKLCGREFIRAVIFTCGGSRWRRSTEGALDPYQWSAASDFTAEDNQHIWQPGAELSDQPSPPRVASSSFSLADLLAFYGQQSDPTSPYALWGGRGGDPAAAEQPVQSKKKRNFSLGVAGKCCTQGCTKNDIGRLC